MIPPGRSLTLPKSREYSRGAVLPRAFAGHARIANIRRTRPVGAGTDATCVRSDDPWLALHGLVTGEIRGGAPLLDERNRLTRAEALRLFTFGSAYFSGEEDVKGRSAPGQYADFAVLSADCLGVSEPAWSPVARFGVFQHRRE